MTGVQTCALPISLIFDLSSVGDYMHYILSNIKFYNKDLDEVLLIPHELTQKVKETSINKPWIPRPVCSLSESELTVYYDTAKYPNSSGSSAIDQTTRLILTYLSKPNVIDVYDDADAKIEIEDAVIYELINISVFMALENIESQRVQVKGQTITIQE